MKKLYFLAAAMMTAASLYAQDSYPYWYISGEFNNYDGLGQDEWALMDDDEGEPGEFTGTFTVPAGEFKFNLVNPDGNYFVPVNPKNFETFTETVSFTDNVFKGTSALAWEEYEEKFYWVDPTWNGGMITVTIYATENNPKMEIIAYPTPGQDESDYNSNYTIEPLNEDGVIGIYWNDENICDLWHNLGEAYITDPNGTESVLPTSGGIVKFLDSDPFGVEFNIAALELTPGNYTLTVPAQYLDIELDDYAVTNYNPEIVYSFEVKESAVSVLEKENAPSAIYNLQGVKVTNDLNTLPAGIYVINGKKFAIR